MIIPADTPVKEMSTLKLRLMLADIQAELHSREKKKREDAMTQIYKLIEKIQEKNFNIVLIDVEGNEMKLNHITEVYDDKFDTGYAFGNHCDITGESPVGIVGPTEYKN